MKKILGLICLLLTTSVFAQNADKELIPYFSKGKWGYCNKDMKIVIPCQYDQAFPFFEDRALVHTFDSIEPYVKSFFIDPNGKNVINLNSSAMGCPASRFQGGKALVENYNKPIFGEFSTLSVIDKDGNLLQQIDSAALDMNLSMLNEYGKPFDENGINISQSGLYEINSVLVFSDGRKPLTLDYSYISPFNNGYAIAIKPYKENQLNPDMAIINTKGEEIIPAGKFEFMLDYSNIGKNMEGLFPFLEKEKYGYVNLKGEVIIAPKFDMAYSFSEGLAVVGEIYDMDEYETPLLRYGYIDKKGNVIVPYRYDVAFGFSEGLAEAAIKDSIFFINQEGKTAFSFQSKFTEGMEMLPDIYSIYYYEHGFKNGKAILLKDGKIGWIDKKGDYIIAPIFSGVGRIGPSILVNDFENGISRVGPSSALNYNEFYIDESGKPYYEPQAMLLPAHKGIIKRYSSPSKNMVLDTLQNYETPILNKYTGKKDKINGKKGEWLEIDNWGTVAFVFSADFNSNCLKTIDIKGTILYDSKEAKKEIDRVSSGSLVFLAPKEKISKIGSSKMINVLHYTFSAETDSGFKTESVWLRGDQVKLINK